MKRFRKVLVLLMSMTLCQCKDTVDTEESDKNTEEKQGTSEVIDNPPSGSEEQEVHEGPEEEKIKSKSVEVLNYADTDYKFVRNHVLVYTVPNSELPYIDVANFIQSFEGYFDNEFECSYQKEAESMILNHNNSSRIEFDAKNDVIKAESYNTFYEYCTPPGGSDYSEYVFQNDEYYKKESTFEMKVGEYDFDIIYGDNLCLIPFFLANLLFCSFAYLNIFYNNELCFVTFGEPYQVIGYDDCNDRGNFQSAKFREENINSLCLIFDYYYGLKDYKGFSDGIKKHIEEANDGKLMEDLLSSNPEVNLNAYNYFIYNYLDELHTRIDVPSFYRDPKNGQISPDYGSFYTDYYSTKSSQTTYRQQSGNKNNLLRYYDDLAVITLNSFTVGTKSQTKNSDGTIKTTAWAYDSYYFMQKVMREISDHSEVKNVVIDLSTNGGGELVALERVMGFLTDEKIPISLYDSLDNSYSIYSSLIDTDGDGNYPDDAYDQYNWYLLTGINTFSAANLMASVFKQMNLGKIIGQKSGGGMCAVLPTILADGTAIAISSPLSLQYSEKIGDNQYSFSGIESGIDVDISLDYKDFYNDVKLYNAISSSNN